MKQMTLGADGPQVSAIALGCMRLTELDDRQAASLIDHALALGISAFDHADIYGGGECERRFARAARLSGARREGVFIQSKCGIRRGYYDFSFRHIMASVDDILQRLQCDYLDMLLLHRPDALVEPQEVAEAFDRLQVSGKVRAFGVSNHAPLQMALLQKFLTQPPRVNQMQFGIAHCGMVRSGINVNVQSDAAVDRDGDTLNYCRLHDITLQAWSPFQFGMFSGVFLDHPDFAPLNQALETIAARHGVSKTTLATAWILRHPAQMQVVAGSMNAERLAQIAQACEVSLSREEWYQIYLAAGNPLP
ncbi:aldo/keto reductase [Edwardsiella piscicida]|uniref:aldo/keto reductase n=1 Tax=Edwardsiella piscicida TaxID=1263550 RepID=UPI001CED8327|nr:aldo/keto reductase [Edwardsiella piscicida]AOP43894.2 aldo/keto reductase [Edwardsiella piscicida]UCQ30495.1 aldo/keto reductase [Edwardsiella piscicida]